MVIVLSSSTVKAGLISTGVLSAAVLFRLSSPFISEFVASDVPFIYSSIVSLLKPPYLYLLINCIIISIFASSKFQKGSTVSSPYTTEAAQISGFIPTSHVAVYEGVVLNDLDVQMDENVGVYARKQEEEDGATVLEVKEDKKSSDEIEMDGGDERMMSVEAPQRSDSTELSVPCEEDKPPVSTRFGQRKAVKAAPEGGKALRVSKQKREETLESTWKAITEGRGMPLARHLKKSDTWDSHVRTPPLPLQSQKMKKSETFNDRRTTSKKSSLRGSPPAAPASGRLRREPSLGQEELNRRVEAFIKKFNEEMRLQRQASLDRYREMIERGAC